MFSRQKPRASRAPLRRYIAGAMALWTVPVALSLTWDALVQRRQTCDVARLGALAAYQKELAYTLRGVDRATRPTKAAAGAATAPQPPPSMACDEHTAEARAATSWTALRGLEPRCPEHAPDPWERHALERLARGEAEVSSVEMLDGKPHLRLIRPMMAEKVCLLCHAARGRHEGQLLGGISVAVGLAPLQEAAGEGLFAVTAAHALLWVVGLAGIALAGSRLRIQDQTKDEALDGLTEERNFTSAILDTAGALVVVLDAEGRIVRFNRACEEATGYSSAEAVGKAVWDLLLLPEEG